MARRVVTSEEVVAAAQRRFLAEGRLDMSRVAGDLSVSRATLYRVATSHDRLLGDVLWRLGERSLGRAERRAREGGRRGVERMLETSRLFEADIADFEPLQQLLRRDPLTASRVLLTPAGQVHQRAVDAWVGILGGAVAGGELELPLAPDEFAFLYVRLGESLLYGEMIAGIEPTAGAGDRIRRALFHPG